MPGEWCASIRANAAQTCTMLNKRELEELRPWVDDHVSKVLGFSDRAVVSAALDCVGRSLSSQAAAEHLKPFLDDAAPRFTETLYRKVLEVKSSKLAGGGGGGGGGGKKRSVRDVFGDNEEEEEGGGAASPQPALKRKRISRFTAGPKDPSPPPPPLPPEGGTALNISGISPNEIQQLLASTKKQIEERKKQTHSLLIGGVSPGPGGLLPMPPQLLAANVAPPPPLPPPPPAPQRVNQTPEYYHNLMADTIEKAKKAAELQARIQTQLLTRPNLLTAPSPGVGVAPPTPVGVAPASKPTPLILDDSGRVVDSSGRAVSFHKTLQPTIKANIRAQHRATFRQFTEQPAKRPKKKEGEPVEKGAESGAAYFDPRVAMQITPRSRKQLQFNEPGKYIKQGQVLRAKSQLEQLQSQISSIARKTGISSATKLALIAPSKELFDDDIPLVEWWDSIILPSKSYSDFSLPLGLEDKYLHISALIEHPVPLHPPGERPRPRVTPIMLTKKERKKLRKQRRREEEREKQEKIQFGLIDKPEPKVRISNLMRVLGNDAVQDPTKVEAHVRAQMAERQKKHEAANLARKLTPEQRRAKKLRKLKEDLSCGVHVTVYRVRDLRNPATKFKVDMNAQQFHLTGCVMLYHDVNLVIVEGGPKGLKKFKRLMLHRIDWSAKKRGAAAANEDDEEDSDAEAQRAKENACRVVWEGKVDDRAFNDWKVQVFPTESLARAHLKKHCVEHYWDLALSQTIVEQEDLDN